MRMSYKADRLRVGVCYYPEQWPQEMWEPDFRSMREIGISIVRMAEFAWAILEPTEGVFSFTLFDRALEEAHKNGLRAILGTPTAAPPAWLTKKYPEVLNVSLEGVRYRHGARRHYNYNATVYRDLCARIVHRLAEHYGNHPAVMGWQIDNEINCEVNVFYSEADHAAFRSWLKDRYGTVDRLNEAWGAVFWSQSYSAWEEVRLTGPTVSASPNPHQALDEKRFFSDSAISFVKLQADIIRKIAPHQFITTNGLFGHLDSHRMTEEALDFLSYDSYPNFNTIYPDEGPDPLLDRRWGISLSTVRSISPHFVVLEQQAGAGGWVNRMEAPSPKPGQMRLWTFQSIAHGADAVLYFRWRTATMGTEIYWHGINDWHNKPNRRMQELRRITGEVARIDGVVAGSEFLAEAALLKDYDNEWDGELDRWHGPLERRSIVSWYKAFQRRHIPVDVVYLRDSTRADELLRYRVIVYPHPAILTDQRAALLRAYAEAGGRLILGCRTGYKDLSGRCFMRPLPGPASELAGIEVEDFTLIGPDEASPPLVWEPGVSSRQGELPSITADGFNDILSVTSKNATVLARYGGSYYAGKPALVRNRIADGEVCYYGAEFNPASAASLIELVDLHSPAEKTVRLPETVELCVRRTARGERILFLLNYAAGEQTIELHNEYRELLTERRLSGAVPMEPFGVFVLRLEEGL